MKRNIDVLEQAGVIMPALKKGVLLTTQAQKVNSMTISWGMLGIEWGKPLFITVVRESRFTHQQLERNPEFTVNIPYGVYDPKILSFCGSKSGRDLDKIAELGLDTVPGEVVSVPAICQLPLTLECRVLYKQLQDPLKLPKSEQQAWYPAEPDGKPDRHYAWYGEIVAAYILD